jgi:hypothetical protein
LPVATTIVLDLPLVLELTKFHRPPLVEVTPAIVLPNALGLWSVMFTVDSVDDTVARLRAGGAELIGEVAQCESLYRLCYMRGPSGIIAALADEGRCTCAGSTMACLAL